MKPFDPDQRSIIPRTTGNDKTIPDLARDIFDSMAQEEEQDFDDNIPRVEERTDDELIDPFDPDNDNDIPWIDEDEEYSSSIEEILRDGGTDVIAFYKSFRNIKKSPARGKWGIFFIKDRVKSLIIDASLACDPSDINRMRTAYYAVTNFLYGHEIYHYKIDAMCLQKEATSLSPIYSPYRNFVNRLPIGEWWEEAVANHYGLSALSINALPGVPYEFFQDLVRFSPGAYSNGVDGDVLKWSGGRGELADQLSEKTRYNGRPHIRSFLPQVFYKHLTMDKYKSGNRGSLGSSTDLLALGNCPVYWISWLKSGVFTPFKGGGVSLKEMKDSFVKAYLNGTFDHKGSKHEYWRIDNGELLKIPNEHHQKNIKPYEFKNLTLKAGMTQCGFFKARIETKKWTQGCPRQKPLGSQLPSFTHS